MDNIIVAIPNDIELAESLGKKGSEGEITFYNKRANGVNIVVLSPSNVNEKYYGVPESILISDIVIASTRNIDALFGEILIACDLLNKRLILTDDNSAEHITKNLSVEVEICQRDAIIELVSNIAKNTTLINSEESKVVIDRAFPVKGVGDIALGIVRDGTIKVHDNLIHTNGKTISIRHIQCHDIDVMSADSSTRVGISLKGIDSSDIEKGDILSKKQVKRSTNISIKIDKSKLLNLDVSKEKFDVAGEFSYSSTKVLEYSEDTAKLLLAKALPLSINDKLLLVRNKQPRIFAVGSIIGLI